METAVMNRYKIISAYKTAGFNEKTKENYYCCHHMVSDFAAASMMTNENL